MFVSLCVLRVAANRCENFRMKGWGSYPFAFYTSAFAYALVHFLPKQTITPLHHHYLSPTIENKTKPAKAKTRGKWKLTHTHTHSKCIRLAATLMCNTTKNTQILFSQLLITQDFCASCNCHVSRTQFTYTHISWRVINSSFLSMPFSPAFSTILFHAMPCHELTRKVRWKIYTQSKSTSDQKHSTTALCKSHVMPCHAMPNCEKSLISWQNS